MVLGGFRFAEDDFSSNHWTLETCLEKPRSWGLRTLPSDEPHFLKEIINTPWTDPMTDSFSRSFYPRQKTIVLSEADRLNWPTFSVARSREVDRLAMEEFSVAGIELMRNAGAACADRLLAELADRSRRTIVLTGAGNNGGDGYVIARCLAAASRPVRVYSLVPVEKLSGDALLSYQDAVAAGVKIVVADSVDACREIDFRDSLIVDCLLGTGSQGAPRCPFAEVIERANAVPGDPSVRIHRVAIDVPSGFDGDSGEASDPTFRADLTLTFVTAKTGMRVPTASRSTGEIEIVDIGLPEELKRRLGIPG